MHFSTILPRLFIVILSLVFLMGQSECTSEKGRKAFEVLVDNAFNPGGGNKVVHLSRMDFMDIRSKSVMAIGNIQVTGGCEAAFALELPNEGLRPLQVDISDDHLDAFFAQRLTKSLSQA